MTVKAIVYFLIVFIFLVSIGLLSYSITNKKKKIFKYIIITSLIYSLFTFLDIFVIPSTLYLDIGFIIFLLLIPALIVVILFIISIVVSAKHLSKSDNVEITKIEKNIFIFLIIFPILIFSISYVNEVYSINNSNVIIVYSSGEEFNKSTYAYAIENNYFKSISIGTEFGGYGMKHFIPKDFKKLNGKISDSVEIDDNKITIYNNNGELIYEGHFFNIPVYEIEEIFYK